MLLRGSHSSGATVISSHAMILCIEEHFPAGHDDMVGAMTQAAAWLLQASQHGGAIYNAFTGQEIPGCYS